MNGARKDDAKEKLFIHNGNHVAAQRMELNS